jgi:hypothetical protein
MNYGSTQGFHGLRIQHPRGRAEITLTSAAETVAHLTVMLRNPTGRCASGAIDREFL